jgi:hypothetical protein
MSQISGVSIVAVIDEFKDKLRSGEIFEALTIAMSEAIELKVTTWVSSAGSPPTTQDFSANGTLKAELETPSSLCLHTRINLVDGEVENRIGSEFIDHEAYAELQKFHLEQVKEGREILLKNLESLQKMFVVMTNTMSQLPKTSSPLLQPGSPALASFDRKSQS